MKFALLSLALATAPAFASSKTVNVAGTKAKLSTSQAAAAITCPQGESLAYSIRTENLSGVTLAQAQKYFANWASIAPGKHISSTGSGSAGATRVYNTTDGSLKATASIRETLTQVISPSAPGGNLEQKFQLTSNEVYYSGSLIFYQDYTDVTVGQPNGGSVFIQEYKNVCTNNKDLAYKALAQKLQDDLAFWINGIKNPTPTSSSVRPSSTSSLPPPNPTQSTIGCKSGQSLTYAIQTQMDPDVTLAAAQSYFRNWIGDAPSTSRRGSTGNNGIGSTRSWTVTDSSLQASAPINEVLTNVIYPSSGNSNLRLQWQITSTQGYYNNKLLLFQAFNDLTIGQKSGGPVFLQYFTNVCANDQSLANKALPTILLDALNFWNAAA